MTTTPRTTEVERDALKSCPFCGGPSIATERPSKTGWRVMCHTDCDIFGDFDTRAEAIAAWNRRPAPAADGRVEIREALRELVAAYDYGRRVDHAGTQNEITRACLRIERAWDSARSALASDTATREGK